MPLPPSPPQQQRPTSNPSRVLSISFSPSLSLFYSVCCPFTNCSIDTIMTRQFHSTHCLCIGAGWSQTHRRGTERSSATPSTSRRCASTTASRTTRPPTGLSTTGRGSPRSSSCAETAAVCLSSGTSGSWTARGRPPEEILGRTASSALLCRSETGRCYTYRQTDMYAIPAPVSAVAGCQEP